MFIINFFITSFTAVSQDGSSILLIKKKDIKGTIWDHLSKSKNGFGCSVKNGNIVLEKSIKIETQTAMHICNIHTCFLFFANSRDHTDYVLHEVEYENLFFENTVHGKITDFFENYLITKVCQDDIPVKN